MDKLVVNRSITKKSSLSSHEDDNFVKGSVAERILMVWPVTREIVSMSDKYDVERRLQRDITVLSKRRR